MGGTLLSSQFQTIAELIGALLVDILLHRNVCMHAEALPHKLLPGAHSIVLQSLSQRVQLKTLRFHSCVHLPSSPPATGLAAGWP